MDNLRGPEVVEDYRRPMGIAVFMFFSNRLGCLGSVLVSAVLTVALLLVFGVL